jgi:hypothetical protein
MDERELIIAALLKALRAEWTNETPVADMVRWCGVTAEELAAVENRFQ